VRPRSGGKSRAGGEGGGGGHQSETDRERLSLPYRQGSRSYFRFREGNITVNAAGKTRVLVKITLFACWKTMWENS
jgi:DsbC/DsbD-like thiol-disulfide interchange protein